jgi:hypothetical protein
VDAELKAELDLASVKKVVPLEGDDLTGKIKADVKMKGKHERCGGQRYEKFTSRRPHDPAERHGQYKSDSLPYGVGINSLVLRFQSEITWRFRVSTAAWASNIKPKVAWTTTCNGG